MSGHGRNYMEIEKQVMVIVNETRKMIRIRYNHWGGVINESNVIHQLHDQWCEDNGYRITDQDYKPGRKTRKKK